MPAGRRDSALRMWMVRSGRGGRYAAQRIEEGRVSLGWGSGLGPEAIRNKSDAVQKVREFYPDLTAGQVDSAASQIWRFINELKVGEAVVTYDPETRLYHVGKLTSDAKHDPAADEEGQLHREVDWEQQVSRDALSLAARNSLGSVLTLFEIDAAHASELLSTPSIPPTESESAEEVVASDRADFEDLEARSLERIKDRISRLDWNELQELVASLLRAMGYKTRVSPPGPDRGRDILASPDGFGFEQPRIAVEVKHRRGQMGTGDLRSFLAGLHSEDRGLYVSTGGFSKEAWYEADRARNVTHLLTADGLARALIEHYENLDSKGRSLLPLTKVYWPA